MRALEAAVVGAALLLVVAGVALGALATPGFTRMLVRRLDVAGSSGLAVSAVEDLAERARVFVTDRSAPDLPVEFDSAPAFDSEAVSHLEDVREVLLAARAVTGVLAALLAVWLTFSVARKHFDRIASALLFGAAACVTVPVAVTAVGAVGFESFFAAFHGLFFEAGTWTFPSDSLLIRLFPERFWMSAGAAWAAGILLGGIALGATGFLVRNGAVKAPGAPSAMNR